MMHLPGVLRTVGLTLASAGLVTAATFTTATARLAAPHQRAGLPQTSSVLVSEVTLICPGQSRQGAEGLRAIRGSVRAAVVAPPAGLVPGVDPARAGRVELTGIPSSTTLASSSDRGRAVTAVVDPKQTTNAVAAHATGSLAPGLVATQVWAHSGDDDQGLAVTPCSAPSADLWLVGGGGGPNRTERLVLTNPGANAVSVRLDVLGVAGRVDGAGDRSISIPPRSREVVSLDAVAPGEAAPAVHVVATGGMVSGVLVDSWIEGATARGTDDATGSVTPGTDLVVPPVTVDGAATLRLVNPGATEALVQVRLVTSKGGVQPEALRAVRVPPASTKDVALTGLAKGLTGVHLRSDQPVTAAAWVERRAVSGADRVGDFGWVPATAPVQTLAGMAMQSGQAGGLDAELGLVSLAGGTATVTFVRGTTTTSRVVTLGPESVTSVRLGRADQVWVAPVTGDVRAAVSVFGGASTAPYFSVAALRGAPITALSRPVRQVGS